MNKYTCIVVDDEPLARELLLLHLAKIPQLQLLATCANAIEAKFAIEKYTPDLLFIDIQMPHLTGIELLRLLTKRPLTILTTAHTEYALEGYELDVLDYLLKPIEFERFFKAVSKAVTHLEQVQGNKILDATPTTVLPTTSTIPATNKEPYFFVKSDYRMVKVLFDDILFVEAMQKYVRIHTSGTRIITLMSMSQLEEILPPQAFVRIHRSYIIQIHKIDSVEGNMVHIGKHDIPISRGQREAFLTLITQKKI